MHNTAQQTALLSNIQMLRAVAAILVLLHHALAHYIVMGGDIIWIKKISEWGFLGVDIFFIISGYIMAYTTFNKPRTFQQAKRFLKHRLFRIYLGYWPFLFLMALILYKKDPQHLFALDWIGSFFLTQTDMFKLILPVSWSLSYELYFYFLFAATLFIPVKKLYSIIPVIFLGLLVITLYFFNHPTLHSSFFYSPFLLEFFAGVLLYMYRGILIRLWVLPVALFIAVYAYQYGILHETKNGWMRIATFGAGAAMVVLSALILEHQSLYKAGRIPVAIGDASYTLYLSHLIILELFYYSGLRSFFTSQIHSWLPLVGLFVIILLCIIFSLLYYKHIEKPLYTKAIRFS